MDRDDEPQVLWVPPRHRRPPADPATAGHPRHVRFRRSILRGAILGPCLIIVALWALVSSDGPAERAEATVWCGSALALVLAGLLITHWPAVDVGVEHLRWTALPRPGAVSWSSIRSVSVSAQSIRTGTARVRAQWATFVINDPNRGRDVTRHLAMLGLPRRELLIQCAANAAPTNPRLAAALSRTAGEFGPTGRLQAIGSSPAAYVLALAVALGSAAAVVITLA